MVKNGRPTLPSQTVAPHGVDKRGGPRHSGRYPVVPCCLGMSHPWILFPSSPWRISGPSKRCPRYLFRLRDVGLWICARSLDLETCTDAELLAATFATLTFTRQKNGVRNETIGHGRSGHPTLCPVLALVSRVRALRHLHAPPSAPINAFATTPDSPLQHVQAADITHRLRLALAIHPDPAIPPSQSAIL